MKLHTKVSAIKIVSLIFVISIFSWGAAYSQGPTPKTADRYFERMSYSKAAEEYEDFLEKEEFIEVTQRKEALIRLGYCYRKLNNYEKAERTFEELVTNYLEVPSDNYLYYAQALASNRKYKESRKMYEKYGELQKIDINNSPFKIPLTDINRFYKDSSLYKLEYLPFNSKFADFSPMFYQGGLVFISSRDGGGGIHKLFKWDQTPFLDIMFHSDTSKLIVSQNNRMSPTTLGGAYTQKEEPNEIEDNLASFSRTLNGKYHEGPLTFFKDQKRLIFTRSNDSPGKAGKSSDLIHKLKLFYAEQNSKGSWINISELPFNYKEYSTGHPALTFDNKKLYFVSDMPGGFGGTDLYVVDYENGIWGEPRNLGFEINTEGNEMFPYVDENGVLYFSSNGHDGLGGLDIFKTIPTDPQPTIQNLGAPFNSSADDFGIIIDQNGDKGYLSSNRKKGGNDDNIYRFEKICKSIDILVFDKTTKKRIPDAEVRIVNNGINQELIKTDNEGKVEVCLNVAANYIFKVMKEGYGINSVNFSILSQQSDPTMGISIYLEESDQIIVKGVIRKEVDQIPADGVTVTLSEAKEKKPQVVVTGADGSYEFDASPKSKYTLKTDKQGYGDEISEFKTKKRPGTLQLITGIYGEGNIFQLDNIYYNVDQWNIRSDAFVELKRIVALMKKHPEFVIELRSHTDSRADRVYNQVLSEKRARSVVQYLINKGIDPDRMIYHGYGESELLNACGDGEICSEEQHQLNRRTEFKILSVSSSDLSSLKSSEN